MPENKKASATSKPASRWARLQPLALTLWTRGLPWAVGLFTAALLTASFPPFDAAQAAYFFAVPYLVWGMCGVPARRFFLASLGTAWAAWFAILIWLRFVHPPYGWIGLTLLSFVLALFWLPWAAGVWWAGPRIASAPFPLRLLGLAALGALWVLTEWLRSWVLTGFPWLPLAASQWQRPALLQPAAWAGAYGVSFILIFFNLGIASFAMRLVAWRKHIVATGNSLDHPRPGWLQLCPEFFLALASLLACGWLFYRDMPDRTDSQPMFRVGIVQPYIPATLKWDPAEAPRIMESLEKHTRAIRPLLPDFYLWPEAATPYPVIAPNIAPFRDRLAQLAADLRRPILTGSLAVEDSKWYNIVALFDPKTGLAPDYYAKRRLVPFGEYVPRWLPFIEKVVPLEGEFSFGERLEPLAITTYDGTWRAAPLICYEDIFPTLARASAAHGADFFIVVTNDAWYGEEGGAYQHAAHSVLRAVETRRPVIRCGNGGWSGWIDEQGRIRDVLLDQNRTIYHKGAGVFDITRDSRWVGKPSHYVTHGDWFIQACILFAAVGLVPLRFVRPVHYGE